MSKATNKTTISGVPPKFDQDEYDRRFQQELHGRVWNWSEHHLNMTSYNLSQTRLTLVIKSVTNGL